MDDPATVAYGDDPAQVADLHLPEGDPPWPVAVLVHGGFWARRYERDVMAGLAGDLVARGRAVWNVEYRRTRMPGGGWPGTFLDVAAATDALASLEEDRLDLGRLVGVGHSVGATMVAWLAARTRLQPGEPGAGPTVVPSAVVLQAGVLDLEEAARHEIGGDAVPALLGDPADAAARYALASPLRRVPLGVPALVVHGEVDDLVPPSQSTRFAAAATAAGDRVDLVLLPDAGHFDHLDPDSVAWRAVRDRIGELIGDRGGLE